MLTPFSGNGGNVVSVPESALVSSIPHFCVGAVRHTHVLGTRDPRSFRFTVPAAVALGFLNLKFVKFCLNCGYRNIVRGGGVDYCHGCGAELPRSRPDR